MFPQGENFSSDTNSRRYGTERLVMDENIDSGFQVGRREVLTAGTAAAALCFTGLPAVAQDSGLSDAVTATGLVTVELQVNGQPYVLRLDPRTTLLDALREHFALTGSKKGCDH